jgi:hypothetical protein
MEAVQYNAVMELYRGVFSIQSERNCLRKNPTRKSHQPAYSLVYLQPATDNLEPTTSNLQTCDLQLSNLKTEVHPYV